MRVFLSALIYFVFHSTLISQNTVGLITRSSNAREGYVLFAPLYSTNTFLVDKCGKQVRSWKSDYQPGRSVHLLPNGDLLRSAKDSARFFQQGSGRIEIFNWNNKLLWSYKLSDSTRCIHHDIHPLPNGNILVLVWEKITRDKLIEKGRDPAKLGACIWGELILELKPEGKNGAKVVWEWRAIDHVVQQFDSTKACFGSVSNNPQLYNINYGASKDPDWLHFNSIAYHAEFDQIIISNRNFNELIILDHSTTKAESASHKGGKQNRGGDLLYRWGNPQTYEMGTANDQKLFGQHSANWISKGSPDEGKIIVFNNGIGRSEDSLYSSVDIIAPTVTKEGRYKLETGKPFLPIAPFWRYFTPERIDFYSKNVSGAQRLSNGNTLICSGETGRFFEIDSNNNIVWTYINPITLSGNTPQGRPAYNNPVFRCTHYDLNYPAFKGKKMVAGNPIEANPKEYICAPGK